MSARTGSAVVPVLRPATLATRDVSEPSMDFEFGLIELTPIELTTEDGVTLTFQHDANPSADSRPGAQQSSVAPAEPPTLGAATSAGAEPLR